MVQPCIIWRCSFVWQVLSSRLLVLCPAMVCKFVLHGEPSHFKPSRSSIGDTVSSWTSVTNIQTHTSGSVARCWYTMKRLASTVFNTISSSGRTKNCFLKGNEHADIKVMQAKVQLPQNAHLGLLRMTPVKFGCYPPSIFREMLSQYKC